jgi:predicted ATPase/DNA-binding SARP family transcriptional activator
MRVRILGPLEVVADGDVVQIGGARLRALVIRLALDAGRIVTVESLSQALWPDDGPDDRVHAVQSLVSRLRRALPEGVALRQVSGGYCLDLPAEAVDALRFERLAREGRRALRNGETDAAVHRLREALALWRGEALADVAHAPYAVATTGRLEELRLSATEDRVAAELETVPKLSPLVAELEELVAAHPLRERLRGLLVKALHADGRPAEALSAYQEFRRLLADELGADPGPQLEDTYLAVLRGEKVADRSRSTRPRGNLRAPLTSFVGRRKEQTRIAEYLEQGRLVTLVGPGGAGKSRLATTVAAGIADAVPGGVWLVELAPVTDPDDVVQAVVNALGMREAGMPDASISPRDPARRLAELLPAAETLIVLDNCEHVIDAAARLVDDLLGRCSQLRVLATSREPLGILGETLCPVSPLALPVPGTSAAEVVACPSVRLFVDRARSVRADFTVTDDNVAAVIEVCRRLDGLPLAIELAAARLRFSPVEHLAARLDERFQLLTGGSRTALPRHRTLRAVVAWSWDLLSGDEGRLAQRLAVFPAAFTPEAAAQVYAGGAPREALDALVDRSLLQTVDGPPPRYRMLETIREYGLERLAETGEIAQARAAHAACFLDLAERAEPHLRGFGQLPWIRTLAAERDNLLAALHFACDAGDASTAVRLGAALSFFWTIHDDHAEAADRLRAVLDVPGAAPEDARATAAASYLFNAVLSGDPADAKDRTGEFEELTRVRGGEHPAAVLTEATLALIADDAPAGRAAIDRRQPHADPWTRAMLWLTRSFLDASRGDMHGMRLDLTAAAAGFREAGERWGLATSLTYLAFAQATLGYFDDAVAAMEESLGLVRELGVDDYQRVWLAMVRIHTGDVGRARAELLDVVAGAASARPAALARLFLADLARYDDNLEEATRQFEAAARHRGTFDDPSFRVLFHSGSGYLAVATGELEAARQHLAEAVVLATDMLDMPMVAMVAVGMAQLRLRHGAAAAAAELLGAAHALRGSPDTFNPDIARLTRELHNELGEPAYQAAYDHGRRLDRADALAHISAQVGTVEPRS